MAKRISKADVEAEAAEAQAILLLAEEDGLEPDELLAEPEEPGVYLVKEADAGERLDRFLVRVTAEAELSRTCCKSLVDQG